MLTYAQIMHYVYVMYKQFGSGKNMLWVHYVTVLDNKLGVFYQVLQYSRVHNKNAPILTFLVIKLYQHVINTLLSCQHQRIVKKYD